MGVPSGKYYHLSDLLRKYDKNVLVFIACVVVTVIPEFQITHTHTHHDHDRFYVYTAVTEECHLVGCYAVWLL
jgi:hypothetical protein